MKNLRGQIRFGREAASVPGEARTLVEVTAWSLLICGLVGLAYRNASVAPFLLDDRPSIVENPSLAAGVWGAAAWSPPAWSFTTGRPLLNWSFAANVAICGFDPGCFRWINVGLHALNAVLLSWVIAETVSFLGGLRGLATKPRTLGLACGLLWVASPVHTAAVTYVSQRAEVLMAAFNLASVLCFLRAQRSPRPAVWRWAVAGAFVGGVMVKESVVSAPVVCLLLDWTARRRSVLGQLKVGGWWSYAAFVPGLGLLAFLALSTALPGRMAVDGGGWMNFHNAEVQLRALGHYLSLSVWPHPLVFDRGANEAALAAYPIWRGFMALVLAVWSVVAVALGRLAWVPVAAFFILLAPTSSLVPVLGQPVADHRLYLPLGAACAGVVILLFRAAPRTALWAVGCAAIVLFTLPSLRNRDYRTAISIWSDTVAKAPMSYRAHGSLGQLLVAEPARRAEGLVHLREAVRLAPRDAETHYQLGLAMLQEKDRGEALVYFRRCADLDRNHALAHAQAALLLLESDRSAEALPFAQRAAELRPGRADFRRLVGASLRGTPGGLPESLAVLERLVGDFPENAAAWLHRGLSLAQVSGGQSAALECLVHATRLDPKLAPAWRALASTLSAIGGRDAEVRAYEERAAALERGIP